MATTKAKKNTAVEKKEVVKAHPLVKGPRMTEKSAIGAEKGIYTFNVMSHANKNEIIKAIKMLYGVTPVKVAMTKIAKKTVFRRGTVGVKSGAKKAVVYLKKGDMITFA